MPVYDICPDWVRPCEWPALPTIQQNEEKVVGLVAVEDTDSEFLAVLCEGDYIVDWGDGSEEEYVESGVKAEHHYVYDDVPVDPVCASPLPSSSSSSSAEYDGYKLIVVTITPQPYNPVSSSSSEEIAPTLTKVDFQQRHSTAGTNSHMAKWLDLDLNVPNCVSLSLGLEIPATSIYGIMYLTTVGAQTSWLQRFVLRKHSLTSLSGLFAYCANLKKVTLSNTELVTDTSDMFFRCSSLIKVDMFDTSAVTTMYRMFAYCYALKCLPLFDTSAVTDFSYMLLNCLSLPSVPHFDTSAALTLKGMFKFCETLKEIPLYETDLVTDFSELFYACTCLREIPELDTSSATTMSSMFQSAIMLRTIPPLNTASVTSMSNLFYGCDGLITLPAFDCSAIASTSGISNWFFSLKFITRSKLYGLKYAHSYRYSTTANSRALTATALNEIFTNLGTAAGSQTITITNCLGAATCDRTIATAKGWTVTG